MSKPTNKRTMKDPSGGDYFWTQADIDAGQRILGQRMMQGKFNPRTWEGEAFDLPFADGQTRTILPKYFGAVLGLWQKQDPA